MLLLRNPGCSLLNKSVAETRFVVEASQQRAWQVLPRVMYQCLPLEKMQIVDDRTFFADFRWALPFGGGPMFHLAGKFVDMSPPNSLTCILSVKKGIVQLSMKVLFGLRAVDEGKTEVACTVMEEGRETGAWLNRIMRGTQRRFTGKVLGSIKARLEQLC